MKDKPEYNILLFGESGSGKSTTINALANYFRFQSFESAIEGNIVHTVPQKPRLFDLKTHKTKLVVPMVNDPNEQNGSYTNLPKDYCMEHENKLIKIIDTPGVGNTGRFKTDRQNFYKILDHLKTIENLNAICFVIKADATLRSKNIRFYLKKLVALLNCDIDAKNLVFCFTFCRNLFSTPNDVIETLNNVLKTIDNARQSEIELQNGVNCYFVDNESYDYLTTRSNRIPFENSENISTDQRIPLTTLENRKYIFNFYNCQNITIDSIVAQSNSNIMTKNVNINNNKSDKTSECKSVYPFTITQEMSFKESFEHSSKSLKQMINHITNLPSFPQAQTSIIREVMFVRVRQLFPQLEETMEIDTRLDKIREMNVKVHNYTDKRKFKDDNLWEQEIRQLKLSEESEKEFSLIKDMCLNVFILSFYLIKHFNSFCDKLIAFYIQILFKIFYARGFINFIRATIALLSTRSQFKLFQLFTKFVPTCMGTSLMQFFGNMCMVELHLVYLSSDAHKIINHWWNGEITGKRCTKAILDAVIGCGIDGCAPVGGSIACAPGSLIGGFIGGILIAKFSDRLTQAIFGFPKDVALENSYSYFGLPMTVTNSEINAAYREFCLKHHPDKSGQIEEFLLIQVFMTIIKNARL